MGGASPALKQTSAASAPHPPALALPATRPFSTPGTHPPAPTHRIPVYPSSAPHAHWSIPGHTCSKERSADPSATVPSPPSARSDPPAAIPESAASLSRNSHGSAHRKSAHPPAAAQAAPAESSAPDPPASPSSRSGSDSPPTTKSPRPQSSRKPTQTPHTRASANAVHR